ncbi:hypothetical protein E0493_16800 [Roseomonas sp. M0104]|uniref:Uncharacterized protein n=1 Tax=Teichococcus coralli TaxID=2545983 RepID=A0A845BE20_9PROT|nr:hypothetical protein [Pseudoroseomonas coralli]MXP65008.1 hypothetical protein [Pseudoroseomonas coralli]
MMIMMAARQAERRRQVRHEPRRDIGRREKRKAEDSVCERSSGERQEWMSTPDQDEKRVTARGGGDPFIGAVEVHHLGDRKRGAPFEPGVEGIHRGPVEDQCLRGGLA